MITSQSTINGQHQAERFLLNLTTLIPVGDDLHFIIDQHTQRLSAEHDAFLRGFCRRIQKELEKSA